jgi:cytochrome c peroxidase
LFNNGVDNPLVNPAADPGVGGVTGVAAQIGSFKAPTLRNIELTAPYMHDGRFATLEEVVEFYNSGVQPHPNLSGQLRIPPGNPGAGQPRRLNLTATQKSALVAFLKTLTDRTVTTNPKFQDPFRKDGVLVLP